MVKIIKKAKKEKKRKKKTEDDGYKYKLHKHKLKKLKEMGLYDCYIKKDKARLTVAQRQKIDMIMEAKTFHLRTKKYTPLEFREKIEEYFDKKDKEIVSEFYTKEGEKIVIRGAPYTMEGLRRQLGINKKSWWKYRNNPGYEEYHKIADEAKERVVEQIVERGLMKKYDSNFSKFYLSNISSLKDKAERNDQPQIGNIIFVTPKDRDEAQQLLEEGKKGYQGEIVDAETVEEDDENG